MSGAIYPFPTTPSWRDAQFKQRDNFTFFLFCREIVEKTNITWNANNTISFRRLRRWHFDAENSNGTTDDNITTLNPVALVITNLMRNKARCTS
jgi:hypothetical protein